MTCARPSRPVLTAALLLAGCGYSSQYVPPADGRARVLWNDDHLVTYLPAPARTQECHEATWWLRHPAEHRQPPIEPMVWVPRPYGSPSPAAAGEIAATLTVADAIARTPAVPHLDRDLAAILLVLAVVALPIVDVTFAALQPESDARSADAIDEVNAYNDLARSAANPCSQ
jgi:hypothetical protein